MADRIRSAVPELARGDWLSRTSGGLPHLRNGARELLMLDCFKGVVDSGERLLRAQFFSHPDMPKALARVSLEFEVHTIAIGTDPEDDTVVIAEGVGAGETGLLLDPDAWPELRGARLLWAWLLTNQQGYTDGLQLELSFGEHRSRVIQLIVMGSGLVEYQASPAEAARF